MKIVIPMSGFGERFRRVGYDKPKPLIEVDSKPIIQHVVEMFPDEKDFVFICNKQHLNEPAYKMRELLQQVAPQGKIVAIEPHRLGPVHAVQQALDFIDSQEPVIVNYCDFTCYWDYQRFKEFVMSCGCDGAIPAYKGFHPHSLGSTNYAYLKEHQSRVTDIREKQPFTKNRMKEFASSGTYYFKSGKSLDYCLAESVKNDYSVAGEFYVSLAYLPLLQQGADIRVYELEHFMQWGTPEDLKEYNQWSEIFANYAKPQSRMPITKNHAVIVPMAGLGKRFSDAGYKNVKPLIEVKNQPMCVSAVQDLPNVEIHVFVLRKDLPSLDEVTSSLLKIYPNAIIEVMPELTEGQALTCHAGVKALLKKNPGFSGSITFGTCDSGAIYCQDTFQKMVHKNDTDLVAWGARNHVNAIRNPKMYGWIESDEDLVKYVSVKKPLENPTSDAIITGTFTFRSIEVFQKCLDSLLSRNGRVNGEYYLDSCINDALSLGYNCRLFEVDHYVSWGTPDEYKTFEYWNSCFAKWHGHAFTGFKACSI